MVSRPKKSFLSLAYWPYKWIRALVSKEFVVLRRYVRSKNVKTNVWFDQQSNKVIRAAAKRMKC